MESSDGSVSRSEERGEVMKYIVVIEKIGDCETDITKAEYDRLLAVEKQRNGFLALLERFVELCYCCPETHGLARAAIARAKGEGK